MLGRASKKYKNIYLQWFISAVLMFFCTAVHAQEAKVAETTLPESSEPVAVDVLEEAPEEIKTVNTTLIAEVDSTIIVKLDGETLESTEVHRTLDGNLYVNATPIFAHYGNDVEYDDVSKALIVRRSQDNVVMELYTDTGIVKANGKALGKLEHFGEVTAEQFILTPNAIAVLAGTVGTFDHDTNEFKFKLDPRLRIATGFDIFVEDIPLGTVQPEPKSVGPVLLLPIRPIAEALGNTITLSEDGSVLEVRRVQDSVTISLNLSTGLVSVNDTPVGVSKDVAYIDQINLLLPVSAVEALTGTIVEAEAGTDRININLDERLTGAIKPLASVDDLTKDTPFTPESLQFQISPDTGARVQFDAHVGRVNGRLRAELPDLPSNTKELRPSWLSVDFAHTNGVTGSIGDYSASFRELDSVGSRRIVGVAAQKETDSGRWSFAAGAPHIGVERISGDQTRNEFGGIAAGLRYADRDGWEAGLAVAKDELSDDQRAVLNAISGRLGRKRDDKFQWNAGVSLGAFSGELRESTVDLSLNVDGRYELSPSFSVDSRVDYVGAEFLGTTLQLEEQEQSIAEIIDPDAEFDEFETPPDIRRRGSDQLSVSAGLRYLPRGDTGFLNNPAATVSLRHTKTGFAKSGITTADQTAVSAGASTSIADTGLNLSVNGSVFETKSEIRGFDEETRSGHSLSAQAYKQFNDYTVRAQYSRFDQTGTETRESGILTVNRNAFNFDLPKAATLSVSPSVTGIWDGDVARGRFGVSAALDSGDTFGPKNRVSASFGLLQNISTRGDGRSDKFLTVSAARQLPIGKNMSLGLSYRNNLNGDHRLGLQLLGSFNFNEKRAIKKTEDGRGILKGQVFLDRNRDGIRQPSEPGIPRTIVRVKGTSLALRSGADGFFTIQNVKEGLYEVQIDAGSLPIGYDLTEDLQTRVTIADGLITDIPLPIVQRGQIRGFAFEDENGNGEYDRGENRVEGAKLRIESEESDIDETVITTSFGQYAFDDLPQGTYKVHVMPIKTVKIAASEAYTVELQIDDDLMARKNVIITRTPAQGPPPHSKGKGRKGIVVIEDIETPWESANIETPEQLTSAGPPDIESGVLPP